MENWNGLTPHSEMHNLFACDKPHCGYRLLIPVAGSTEHTCPMIGTITISWEGTLDKMEALWAEADKLMDDFMKDQQSDYKKGLLRGVCIGIRPFMSMWYPTDDDVAREVVARWKARQAGEVRETNGLGSLRTAAPRSWYPAEGGAYTSDPDYSIHAAAARRRAERLTLAEAAARTKVTAPPPGAKVKGLSAVDAATVKRARDVMNMSPEELAKMYNVSVETVKSL